MHMFARCLWSSYLRILLRPTSMYRQFFGAGFRTRLHKRGWGSMIGFVSSTLSPQPSTHGCPRDFKGPLPQSSFSDPHREIRNLSLLLGWQYRFLLILIKLHKTILAKSRNPPSMHDHDIRLGVSWQSRYIQTRARCCNKFCMESSIDPCIQLSTLRTLP